ncbi:MAG: molecular chaperone HtpG [Clostridia bacterium]|nr:molecular chaperone HtpG [Clostridia bacterium]
MAEIKGGIGVEIEHIFPVIKKWLYSEKEIFLREIVSNASDAVTKLRRLISLGEESARDIPDEGFRIDVILDTEECTLTVTDNGIGMTREEVEKYICQIALSGALDFIEKYEGESGSKNGIIGHFGLGFYSAFMVADTVDVLTRSYKGGPAVKWTCDEGGSYVISDDAEDAPERGTSIVMHLGDEGREYLDPAVLRRTLMKYCAFMPCDIYFDDGGEKSEDYKEEPVNDKEPLWQKNPSECTDEDYKDFYHRVFSDMRDPLFWIHIKADYPLNFRGILYFPRINSEFESLEGQVKLYYNQVFVADNIKEVIPEYLLMLKGVLDCPELPLNVSRSYLQNNGYVTKISNHITKKVADKLTSMFNLDRESYEKQWPDIRTFVEYGCLRDRKFYSKASSAVLYERCDGTFVTLPEYLEAAKDKHEGRVYYAQSKTSQAAYISMFESEGIPVVLMPLMIDSQFAALVESENEGVHILRVDSELADTMKEGEAKELTAVLDIFKEIVPENTEIRFEALKDESLPALLNVSEDARRMEDMMRMYSMMGKDAPAFPTAETLILNSSCPIIASLEAKERDKAALLARQIYKLCRLSHGNMDAEELKSFLSDSYSLLSMI